MNKEIVDRINAILKNDEITITIPIGEGKIEIKGKASIDEKGNIVISNTSFTAGKMSIENGTVTIERGSKLSYGNDINLSIDGKATYGEVTRDVKDVKLNINNNKLTVSNTPFGVDEGTYDLSGDGFSITNPDEEKRKKEEEEQKNSNNGGSGGGSGGSRSGTKTGEYGKGDTVGLGNNDKNSTAPKNNNNNNNNKNDDNNNQNNNNNDTNSQKNKEDDATAAGKQLTQFNPKTHADYWPQEFQDVLDKTSGTNYDTLAQELKNDVSYLTSQFSQVYNQMKEWAGAAEGSAKAAINCILNKFECTMNNINESIGPACTIVEEFKDKLEKLKAGKEELTGADGNGGLDKDLEDAKKEYEEKLATYNSLNSNPPSPTRWVSGGKDGEGHNEANPAYAEWQAKVVTALNELNTIKSKKADIEAYIKAKETELNALFEEVRTDYETITNLVNTVKTFKEYFGTGSKASLIASPDAIVKNKDIILEDFKNIPGSATDVDYNLASSPELATREFFLQAGCRMEGDTVIMTINGKECRYNLSTHKFTNGDTYVDENGHTRPVELETYFYLPSHIVESGDYSQLANLNTYTFFSADMTVGNSGRNYKDTINERQINTVTMEIIKQDPLNPKYDAVADVTKMANAVANTDLTNCYNSIGGDSVYGAHSLKISAQNGDLYKTVYCIDNAAIVTGENGKAGTKEQFNNLDELKGLNNKNIYFINTSGDDNYAYGADMSVQRGRAYVEVGSNHFISENQVKNSFTYTGIELVAENCPDSNIHIVYQDQDTAQRYQSERFPIALDELDQRFDNVSNDSADWDEYARAKYQTHSEGNYIPHDLAEARSTKDPTYNQSA